MADITSVLLEKYTHPTLGKRGRIIVTLKDGQKLPVESLGEEFEASGAARFDDQWNRAVNIARETNTPFGFVDLDLVPNVAESHHKEG